MTDLNKLARNSVMVNGTTPYMKTGASRYDEGLKKQYFAEQTRLYAQEIGPSASNVYDAMCQGVSEGGDWYDWRKVRIRVSPAATASTGETMPDDWMKLHIIKPVSIDTVPIGAYLTFAGNTWIVYKGKNMGSVIGDGIIRRCNSVINVLDWYGNIVPVPMSYAKMGTLGNASHATENSIVAKNYISCICQLNEYSAAFQENTRIILGKTAYSMRGLNDFTREFTDDQESVHLLTFTIERSAPLPQDSLEKQCADYESFRWDILVTGQNTLRVGGLPASMLLNVSSVRKGVEVASTMEHPISYLFSSSDESVATVDSTGRVTPVSAGTAVITVSLAQNPEIKQTFAITVVPAQEEPYVQFLTEIPATLREYESASILAAVIRNGQTDFSVPITLSFSGPPERCYGTEETDIARSAISGLAVVGIAVVGSMGEGTKLTAYGASNTPLVITATDPDGNSARVEIRLITGY